jgi:type I restriction enzyme, S subunit
VKYPAYPDYDASDVPWIGPKPKHWQIMKLNHMARLKSGSTITSADLDENGAYPVYGGNGMRGAYSHYTHEGVYALIGRQGAECGNINYAEGKFWASEHAVVVHPDRPLHYQWLGETLRAMNLNQYSQSAAQPGISVAVVGRLKSPFPPLGEQEQIAHFLAWRTAQIDALIAKKQALLERLTEKRANVIASHVTAGLAQPVKVRPSGAAWFTQVPTHWQVKRIKFIGTVGNGSTPARDDSSYWTEGHFPWLNSSVANQEAVTEAEQFVTPLALKECHLPIIEPPAVLVGITGQGKTRGMATTLMIRATINQHLAYIKPDETECDVRFLRRVFDAAYAYLRNESDGGGSTKGAITCEQIAELPIPVPPLAEQQAIADHIDTVLDRINRIADKATNAIERLTEYRSALITAAVTGQIDVRGVTVPPPA